MIKINGKVVYAAEVQRLENNRVYLYLSDSSTGILYASEIGNNTVNLAFFFHIGQRIYVRKKQMLFTGEFLVTMNDLLVKTLTSNFVGEEIYGVVSKKTENGAFVQITPTLHIFINNICVPRNTKILLSVFQNKKSGKIYCRLNSVLYDDYDICPIFEFTYSNIEIIEEQPIAA